jgi:tRNA G26 N,N-dimethylase Trm1
MWMDWVLHGADYVDCFGTANHHLIDAVARTPRIRDSPLSPLITTNHAMYARLFVKAESGTYGFTHESASHCNQLSTTVAAHHSRVSSSLCDARLHQLLVGVA